MFFWFGINDDLRNTCDIGKNEREWNSDVGSAQTKKKNKNEKLKNIAEERQKREC